MFPKELKRQRSLNNLIYLITFLSLIVFSLSEQENISEEPDTVICGGFLKFSEEYPSVK